MELVLVEIKIILKFTITQYNNISPNQQMKQKSDTEKFKPNESESTLNTFKQLKN